MTKYFFGQWHFDASIGELFDGKTTTRLEPQVGKLLGYLLEHQQVLTSRDELINTVWEGRVVSDDAINRCVSILRQTLTPEDRNAYIETVVRRGFISHFPAAPLKDPRPPSTESKPRPKESRGISRTVLGIILLAILILYFMKNHSEQEPPVSSMAPSSDIPVLAVLPFASADMLGDSEFFANGMHDDLLTHLAQIQSIRVISRTSVISYKDSALSILEIGNELGADAILEGGIQRNGDQIRINAQLIDAHTDEHLWAGQFDRELLPANLFDIQTEIARAISTALQTTMTEQDADQLSVLPTQNMAAYRAYHQSMVLRDTVGVDDPAYIQALEKAVSLDPDYVRAWAELAGYLSFGNMTVQNAESIERVEEILEHIKLLAPHSAEYLIAQAYYNYYIIKNYDQAIVLAVQAQNLRPSDPRILELKGLIQRRMGDFDGRIESVRQARILDPRNPFWTRNLVRNLIISHRYDEAEQVIEEAELQSFELAVLSGMLQQRHHNDPASWLDSLLAIEQEYDDTANAMERWSAYIGSRDFASADALLNGLEWTSDANHFYNWPGHVYSAISLQQMITYWLLNDHFRLETLRSDLQSKLIEAGNDDMNFNKSHFDLAAAFVTATEGDSKETARLIRKWRRVAKKDWAEYSLFRHYSCRALGIASAVSAAVDCIREALVEPSLVMPFIEPYLPYYDLIRDEPAFVDLVQKLRVDS